MNQQKPIPPRQFEDKPAVREMTPLLVGLAGPSGCGKTYSALRIATGIQSVTGGEIFGIDTEGRRMLHYADDFRFRHVPFGPPFRSLDYLQAVRYCAEKGARVIVVDSLSHEHEGSGGYLELHETEKHRLSNNPAAEFAAWNIPSKQRNNLIQGLLQLPICFVFCFRAKEKLKPGKEKNANGEQKSVMRELGWMPIGGQAFIYELTVCCLLPPASAGVPDWDAKKFSPEQQLWVKKPKQFQHLFAERMQLSESIGKELALWSNGGNAPPAGWHEQQAQAVSAAVEAATGPQMETGVDKSEPCVLCKNNPPRCKACERELIFTPSGISRRGEPYSAFWRCPDRCKDPEDKRRNTSRTARDWHAILEGNRKLKEEREGSLFQETAGKQQGNYPD